MPGTVSAASGPRVGIEFDLGLAIARGRRQRAGEAAGLDRTGLAAGLADQPEAVAADRVHVGIDDGDRRGHRDHRLDGVAALGEDVAAGLGRQMVRGRDGGGGENGVFGHVRRSLGGGEERD